MSIVVIAIDKNKKLYIASDKEERKCSGFITDDYRKIYQIKDNIYFGMTGVYEVGLDILDLIKKIEWGNRLELIKKVNSCFDSCCIVAKPEKMTMVIAGKDEEGFFILQRNIQGEIKIVNGSDNIELAINSTSGISDFQKYLEGKIISGEGIKDSIIKTIEYASTIDVSISKDFILI